jgi:hypothetical protein
VNSKSDCKYTKDNANNYKSDANKVGACVEQVGVSRCLLGGFAKAASSERSIACPF